MRKIGCCLFILMLVIDAGVITMCMLRPTVFDYFTLYESRGYVDDEYFVFTIYSTDSNYLIGDNNTISLKYNNEEQILNNVDVSVSVLGKYYVYEITTDLIMFDSNKTMNNCKLIITNSLGTMQYNVGNISIIDSSKYTLLGFDTYYGSYSVVNNNLYLTGLNIKFRKDSIEIKDINVSGFAKGNTNLVLQNKLLNYEIDIKSYISEYNILERKEIIPYKTEGYSVFIPVVYDDLSFIRRGYVTMKINDEDFYIDSFSFITNTLDPDSYSYLRREGIKC